jgi:hypothetical protein
MRVTNYLAQMRRRIVPQNIKVANAVSPAITAQGCGLALFPTTKISSWAETKLKRAFLIGSPKQKIEHPLQQNRSLDKCLRI